MKLLTLLALAAGSVLGMSVRLPSSAAAAPPPVIPAGPLRISPEARDLIITSETGGKSYYQSRLQSPSWPGGASGVTIGLGYDVGYNTSSQIARDWRGLPASHVSLLQSAAGIRGIAAKPRASALKWIIVPWTAAEEVFVASSMPRFGAMTARRFPGVTATHGHVQGVMLSLVFNRGDSVTGGTRREMRNCQTYLAMNPPRVTALPAEIRGMKRLWVGKGLEGLLRRRDAEARLVELSF